MIAAALLAGLALAGEADADPTCPDGCPGIPALVEAPAAEEPIAPGALPAVTVTRLAKGYVNVWVLRAGDAVVVVDAHYPGKTDWLLRELAEIGVDPAQINAVVVTHAHADHLGGARALCDAVHAPLVLGAADAPIAAAGHNPPLHPTSLLAWLARPTIRKSFAPVAADRLVGAPLDLREYGIAGEAVAVGGHTPGSVVVRLEDGGVVVGDLVRGRMTAGHRPTDHLYEPDLVAVHAILDGMLAAGATRFYPGHGKELAGEDVRAWLDRKE